MPSQPEAPSQLETLIVRHLPNSDPASFQVARLAESKTPDPVVVRSPAGFPVAGRPKSDLLRELRWYLETFLEYPFPPETDHADHVQASFKDWGRGAFDALFGGRAAGRMFDAATDEAYARLHLQISSDDPRILSWPWECLYDSEVGFLAQTCQIERRLNRVRDPQPLSDKLPTDRVNILLLTARSYDNDVRFRSISRKLVELAEKLPAHVDFLRPPTFNQLREHLYQHPHFYHILHFDGHGSYAPTVGGGLRPGHTLGGREGRLIFKKDDGSPDPILAETLSILLQEYAVPVVVLNACQSAMLDDTAQDPFSSVAAALIRSGTRSVVAMAYSLFVSGAQQFLPAFYRRLFESGSVAEAVRAGRQEMLAHDERVCVCGKFPLKDWLVPVLYQQQPLDFSFAGKAPPPDPPVAARSRLPEEIREDGNPYGFVGRDAAILRLERALRLPPPGVLVTGLGGVGKTTLVRGFLEWLAATNGLGEPPFWFKFNEIRSAEYIVNRMGEALFGPQFSTADMETRIDRLATRLREQRRIIVWDNFESAQGVPGTAVTANLSDADRQLLARFLTKLRGGASKVLLTSRSTEDWLGPERRLLVSLDGLDGEERWDYCTALLENLGLRINREDKDLEALVDLLKGHPLAMRVLLPRLEKMTAAAVLQALHTNLAALGPMTDELEARLFATLRFATEALPAELRPLLIPLAFHADYVVADQLDWMAKEADPQLTRRHIDSLTGALNMSGLLRDRSNGIHEMHPVLTTFLRATVLPHVSAEAREAWIRAFVDVMRKLATLVAAEPLHKQRGVFFFHGENVGYALDVAERLGMNDHFATLALARAAHANNLHSFAAASEFYHRLAEHHKGRMQFRQQAVAYNGLGGGALQRHDLAAAEGWHRKALEIVERLGDKDGAATTYHQLGMVAQERRDFAAAEQWYHKSLEIEEQFGNKRGAATTYNNLGILARRRRDFAAAEQCYRKSLEIEEQRGDEDGAATTYHELGTLAVELRDFAAAERWYRKALEIKEQLRDENFAAMTYNNLGAVADQRRDFAAAEQWYRKSLEIVERLGDEHGAAMTYNNLGMVAQQRRDFAAAEKWYLKSLEIKRRLGDKDGAATTYHQLGMVAQQGRDFAAAEKWYRKSLEIVEQLGNEHGAACTYCQLGILAALQSRFEESAKWLIRSIGAFRRTNDLALAQQSAENFALLYQHCAASDQAKLKRLWEEAGFAPLPEPETTSFDWSSIT